MASRELFRKKSLERLSSPERLDQLLQIADRKSWIPLLATSVLIAGTLLWSVVAKVPVTVEGRGILVRPRAVVPIESPGPGRLLRLEVGVGDVVEHGQVLGRIDRPDLDEQLRLQRQKLVQLTGHSAVAEQLRQERTSLEESGAVEQADKLQQQIRRARDVATRLRAESLQTIRDQETRLAEQNRIARELSLRLKQRLDSYGEMVGDIVSQQDVDNVQTDYTESVERVWGIEAEQSRLATDRLRIEEQYYDRLREIDKMSFELQGLGVREKALAQENLASSSSDEQQIADVEREIERLEGEIAEQGDIVSKHRGRIHELNAVAGAVLGQGERLGTLEVIDTESPLVSLTYFRVRDGKRLEHDDSIRVTPDTVERERYGSIEGVVRNVADFPATVEEAESLIGNKVVAQELIEGGYLIRVESVLAESDTRPGHFRWSSSRGPEDAVSAGTTTTARVAVEYRRPISFVLPILRSATGLD